MVYNNRKIVAVSLFFYLPFNFNLITILFQFELSSYSDYYKAKTNNTIRKKINFKSSLILF